MGYFMRQCTMLRKTKSGTSESVGWIPEQFAKLGKPLKLKDEDGQWVDGWVVTQVGSVRRAAAEVNHRSRDHVRQRDASDV
ncbi:MAG: hypothetical protein KIS92_25035 [Planctomycetota bacterium]|nr:hypothetical protein [Planctomycetota bacterium]